MNMSLSNSGVTWSVVALFVISGLQSISPVVSPTVQIIISAIIGILGLATHNNQIKLGKVK